MISQSMNTVPPGLQALMVLKQQASPVTPQGMPTIAAQTAQQVEQAQNPGLAGIARNAATGNAIELQNQQEAQRDLMRMAEQQAQAQAQQPVLAAEGGIASLDVGGMDDYAEGGVVGFTEGGQAKSTFQDFLESIKGKPGILDYLVELDREMTARRRGQSATQLTDAAPAPAASAQAEDLAKQEAIARGMQQFMGQGSGAGQAPREERRAPPPTAPRSEGVAALPAARSAGVPSIQQLINEALVPMTTAAAGYTAPKQLTPQQIEDLDLAELRRKGLPEQEKAAEEQGLAELRRNNEAIREFQRQMLAKKEAALGTPSEQAMNRFMEAVRYGAQGGKGSFAQGLENAILAERQGAEARDVERLKRLEADKAEAIEYTRIQALIDEARRLKALNRVDEAQKLEEAARQAANDIVKMRVEGAKGAIPSAISAYSGITQQQMQSASAERLAALKGEGASAKPIYDTINDNVEKQLTAWSKQGMNKYASAAEIAAQRAKFVADQIRFAKTAGHTITPEMEALIKGTSAAPGTRENPIKLD